MTSIHDIATGEPLPGGRITPAPGIFLRKEFQNLLIFPNTFSKTIIPIRKTGFSFQRKRKNLEIFYNTA